jgi:hypothetical protein
MPGKLSVPEAEVKKIAPDLLFIRGPKRAAEQAV